jgi:hypothetical protein
MDYLQQQVCNAYVIHGFDYFQLYCDCHEVSICI